MLIEFDIVSKNYLLKDVAEGFGGYFRLEKPIAIKNNCLINIGELHIIFNLQYANRKQEHDPYEEERFTPPSIKSGGPLQDLD
jgi:hypothetical protein